MPLFGRTPRATDEDYSPVSRSGDMHDDDESKPLRTEREDIDDGAAQREIYQLSRSLRRANTFLKIIIALLCVTIISVLSMNVPESVRKIIKSASCAGEALIKTPVPPSMFYSKGERDDADADSPDGKGAVREAPALLAATERHEQQSLGRPPPGEWLAPRRCRTNPPKPGRGFVYVKDWPSYDFQPGQNTSWGMIYSVALFHQMHCLGQLRRFSYLFLDAIVKGDAAQLKEIKHMFGELDHAEHMNHCFDYLRQTIACAGDMAMEWPRTEPDGRRFAVDGWGIPHECKSWVSIALSGLWIVLTRTVAYSGLHGQEPL
jgi:hypothetical protein